MNYLLKFCLAGAVLLFSHHFFVGHTHAANALSYSEEQIFVQDFFSYLLQPKSNIRTDAAAQEKWLFSPLTKLLNEADAAVVEARKFPEVDQGPDTKRPNNEDFLDF